MRLAINIENPDDLATTARYYHPTSQSIEFVTRLASAALAGGGAHALLGAYGAGKSSLAAFALLELSSPTISAVPRSALHPFTDDQSSVSKVLAAGGLAPIPLVGASEPLASRIAGALSEFASKCVAPELRAALQPYRALDPTTMTDRRVLSVLVEVAKAIRRSGRAGTLLVIDEFGRQLEHMLASATDSDFHLLQGIAEATGRADSALSLVIVQHYGLEHYGPRFHDTRKEEWDKVRGRFTETVLNNTETDAAYIVGKVIASTGVARPGRCPSIRLGKRVPRILKDDEFMKAALECRPMHPMTVILLSRLARLLGQHDRSAIGWLTSDMDTGFRAMCSQLRDGWLYPHALYDHFFGEGLLVPSNPVLATRFTSICEANERIRDGISDEARILFKTLALLGFCSGRGIAADEASVGAALPRGISFGDYIEELTRMSLVLFRRHRGEFVVWGGSDFDINRRVGETISAMSVDIAAEMTQRFDKPILARGHFIRTGNRRVAQVLWLGDGQEPPRSTGRPRVLVWMTDRLPDARPEGDVVGAVSGHRVALDLVEAAAIRHLLDHDGALQNEPIAAKELRSRLTHHEERVSAAAHEILDSDLGWHVGERPVGSLQAALSVAMDLAYPWAFELQNELVNRDRPSPQVTFALRKLIERLYVDSGRENLAIERFPAERIIYESLLRRTGLHAVRGDGQWGIQLDGDELPPGLVACIAETRRLFGDPTRWPGPLVESVVDRLTAPPYGMMRTPAVLLCILALLEDKDAHELYEDGRFLADWGPDTLLRLLKNPARFAVAAAAATPVGAAFMRHYCNALLGVVGDMAPVALARETLRRHARLSLYARRTLAVSAPAQAFRRALEVARSPGDMLFRAIPDSLGYASLPTTGPVKRPYLAAVTGVWEELEGADGALLDRMERAVLQTLACSTIREARAQCRDFARGVLADEHSHHGYDRFLSCVVDDKVGDDRAWLTNIVDSGLEIAAPLRSWSDGHASHGEFLLRRNMLAMQETGALLSAGTVQRDASPFVVFWPNPDLARDDGVASVVEEMTALAERIPPSQRMAVIADLARRNRGAE